MHKIFLSLLATAIVFGLYASLSKASELSNRLLGVSVRHEPATGYQIVLANYSGDFLCVDQSMFDTRAGNILLFDDKNKRVALLSSTEPAPDISLGFDFNQAYYLLRPKGVRKIYIDFKNFRITKSKYHYEVSFPYYRCSDVIDGARIKAGKSISTFVARATGAVFLTPEK